MEELTQEENQAFEKAFDSVLNLDKKDYPSMIGGLKVASGVEFEVSSPIDKSIIFGRFQEPEQGLADNAVEAAGEAFKKWSKVSSEEKVKIFSQLGDALESRRFWYAALVTLVSGKTRAESLEEVDSLITIIDDCCDSISSKEGKPVGVWAVVSEFNSPLAAPIGYSCAAMMAGNTVVLAPAKQSAIVCYMAYDILEKAGLPGGVLNLIVGRNSKPTEDLTNNLGVSGIVATGSGKRLEDMIFLQTDDELRFVNEIKGMNPIFVYKPGSMKEAVKTVVDSFFPYMCQRTDSCSKVIVTMPEYKTFLEELLKQAKNITVSDPADVETVAGPLISEEKEKEFFDVLDSVKDCVVFGGKKIRTPLTSNGSYVMPAILTGLPEEHELNEMDSALPIMTIEIANDVDHAIELINCSEYGLSAGILSKEQSVVSKFVDEINADEIFINESSKSIGLASKAKVENFYK